MLLTKKSFEARDFSWESDYRLGDGCKIKHGYAFKSDLTTTECKDGPVVVNIGNFQYSGGFRFEITRNQYYLGDYPKEYKLRVGDILIVMTCQTSGGEILGIPGKTPNDGRVYLHNQRMGLPIITDSQRLDAGFLYWLFLSRAFNQHLFATATGSKILHTAPSRIESFRFSRPPLPIQRRIAAVLSAYDDLIANNQRRIAILEELARSLYREWFVEFRFPGHEGELSIDNIPNGWTNRKLSEVAQVNANSVRRGKEPTLIRYIDIASVSTGQVDNVEEIPFTEAPGRARRIVEHGDIIWSTVRPNRKSYSIILNPLPGTIVSTGFAVISATRLPFTYLYHALTTEDFVAYLTNHAKGSAYPAVSADDFTNAEILIPAENLLETYHAFAEEVLLQQEILSQKNANLRRTRDLLLPRLVSGELDVSELELAGVDAL